MYKIIGRWIVHCHIVTFYCPSLVLISWTSLWENIFLSELVSWSISNIVYLINPEILHQNKQTENHIFLKSFQLISIISWQRPNTFTARINSSINNI